MVGSSHSFHTVVASMAVAVVQVDIDKVLPLGDSMVGVVVDIDKVLPLGAGMVGVVVDTGTVLLLA